MNLRCFPTRVRFGRSGSSEVIDFGANRKCTCDFLLVLTTPLFHPNFGRSRCTRSPMLGSMWAVYLKLFGREIICDVFQPMWSRYLRLTDRQTDGQTT